MASSLCASYPNNLRTKGRALSGLLRCHAKCCCQTCLRSSLPPEYSVGTLIQAEDLQWPRFVKQKKRASRQVVWHRRPDVAHRVPIRFKHWQPREDETKATQRQKKQGEPWQHLQHSCKRSPPTRLEQIKPWGSRCQQCGIQKGRETLAGQSSCAEHLCPCRPSGRDAGQAAEQT